MKQKTNKNYYKKHHSKTNHCPNCQQKKSCGVLDQEKNYCCPCYRKILEELEWDRLLVSSAQQVLNDYRQRIIICSCLESEKVRVRYLNSDGSGWTKCERCERLINSAGHHGVVKNRNEVRFWGLEVNERILCGKCLEKLVEQMPRRKKYLFKEYGKRGYWKG